MKIISGNSNPSLAQAIAKYLGVSIVNCEYTKFADGEYSITAPGDIKNQKVYLVQSTCPPVQENLAELLILLNAVRGAGAAHISVVSPYYGFARQDIGHTSTARFIGTLLATAGAQELITFEVHNPGIFDSYALPVANLSMNEFYGEFLKGLNLKKPMIVSPDRGGTERALTLATALGWPLAIIEKGRTGPNNSHVKGVVGDVKGNDCVLFDDLCDTGGTLCQGASALMDLGAKSVQAVCAHGVLSKGALKAIENSPLKKVYFSNSIPLVYDPKAFSKVKEVCLSSFLGDAIVQIESERRRNAGFMDEFRVAMGKI